MAIRPFTAIGLDSGILLTVQAETQKGLFQNAGTGMMNLITPVDQIRVDKTFCVLVKSTEQEELMVDFLNELLYILETDHFGWKRIDVNLLDSLEISATLHGEKLISDRHKLLRDIKAATYNGLSLGRHEDGIWHAEITFDV